MKQLCIAAIFSLLLLPSYSQNLKEFSDSLDIIFKNRAAGWAYQVIQNNKVVKSNQGGYAIAPVDHKGTGIPFTVYTTMHIASISKAITAIAMQKLLSENKLGWDEKIHRYLPSTWKLHAGFNNLTIRQLLIMTSGLNAPLNASTSSNDSLRMLLERGPDTTVAGKFHYQNTSYGLLRIIMVHMLGYTEQSNQSIADLYINYVKKKVMEPAGIMNAACKVVTRDTTYMYPDPFDNRSGIVSGTSGASTDGNLSDYAGGFGWYLSVNDLGLLMSNLFNNEKILTKIELNELLSTNFPIRLYKNTNTEYRQGGGDWRMTKTGTDYVCGLQTSYYIFSNNTQLIVFHNSAFNARAMIMKAYINCFVQ